MTNATAAPAFPSFQSYVCEGDSVSVDVGRLTFTARIVRDDDATPPDDRDDGFWPSIDPESARYIGSDSPATLSDANALAESIITAWRNDEWFYCGVVISVRCGEITLDENAASLWGVEANYPPCEDCPSPNGYLQTVANELLPVAQERANTILHTLCGCEGEDPAPTPVIP